MMRKILVACGFEIGAAIRKKQYGLILLIRQSCTLYMFLCFKRLLRENELWAPGALSSSQNVVY